MPEVNGNGGQDTILSRALACELSIGRLGIRRKVRSDRVRVTSEGDEDAVQPDADMIGVTKRILACPEYKAIEQRDAKIRQAVEDIGLPSMMRRGTYLIPDGLVETVDEMIRQYIRRRGVLVDAFMAVYEQAATSARESLGSLYDAADYPPASRVRGAFTVSWRWVSFGTPGRMQSVSGAIFAREQARIRAEAQAAAEDIKAAMRTAFQGLIEHMHERLMPEPDGKARVFRDSMVENLCGFLASFKDRNLADDGELAALVEQARGILEGREADDIRRDNVFRARVSATISDIKGKLDGMVVTRGRRFALEEE